MDDLISRQAAIAALNDEFTIIGKTNAVIVQDYIRRVNNRLHNLPSAQPERKKGKWIEAEYKNINTGEKRKVRRCSVCGSGYFRYDVSVNTVSDIPNFCPNCGADMRGEQE